MKKPKKKEAADRSIGSVIVKDFKKNKWMYALAVPAILYYLVFCYAPIYGLIIGFKDYNPLDGILGSPWVGLKHFKAFFDSVYFGRLVKNTLLINLYGILIGFPIPIILALMMNELRCERFKKVIQTTSYLPHFISMVVVCGMVVDFTANRGLITTYVNQIFGTDYKNLLHEPSLYRTIYIASDIWQEMGWGSIIYLAALAGVDMSLYEAAKIDGANKWQQMWHVTIPGILMTIMVMLIMRIGNIMALGPDKTILLYDPLTYETGDIIASYVYRSGIQGGNMSFATAVGLFNSVINCLLVITANAASKKFTDSGLF